jgi:5-methylcytosine-specific restriction endonuclease McrA
MLDRMLKSMAKEAGVDTNRRMVFVARDLGCPACDNAAIWKWLETKWLERESSGLRPISGKKVSKAQKARERAKSKPDRKNRFPKIAARTFYDTDTWRALRFEALKLSNGCCVLCGRSQRAHGVVLHVDHIKPKSKFPELALTLSNLQILCEDCNLGKSNRDDTDWRVATDIDRQLDSVDWKMQ